MIVTVLSMFLQSAIHSKTCLEKPGANLVEMTRAIIVKEVPVEVSPGELPTEKGTQECVRMTFFISRNGRAYNIRTVESSDNAEVDSAFRLALAQFEFKPQQDSPPKLFSLVFNFTDRKLTPEDLRLIKEDQKNRADDQKQ